MTEFNGHLLNEIAALRLPRPDQFVLNSSGALAERGVIPMSEVSDIDGSTSEINHQYLQKVLGWSVVRKVVGVTSHGDEVVIDVTHDADRKFDIHRWDFSQFDYNRIHNGRIMLDEQINLAEQDHKTGIYVATVEYVLRTKRETGREKDDRRIEKILKWQALQ